MATFEQYRWVKEEAWIQSAYCITLISAIGPDDVLASLKARRTRPVVRGAEEALFEGSELAEEQGLSGMDQQVVAVATAGDGWTLMIESNGYIGITDAAMASLTAGHEVVAHSQNVNGDNHFVWWYDGVKQVYFNPLTPAWDLVGPGAACQSSARAVARVTELIGDVGGIELDDPPPGGRVEYRHVEGAFALAERLTGVAVTPHLLVDSTFTVTVVPLNPADPGHDPAADEPPQPLVDDTPTWDQVVKLHEASHKLTVHGTLIETDHDVHSTRSVEFWRKHKRAWRIADDAGVRRIAGRRGQQWFRVDGQLTDEPGSRYTEGLHPMMLLEIFRTWSPNILQWAKGRPVRVAGRPAWEFDVTDTHRNPSKIAFDAETGIAARRETDSFTVELAHLETRIKLSDSLFEGP